MKAYVLCTPTHENLLTEFLIPSLPSDVELTTVRGRQHCLNGNFMTAGWLQCMEEKVQMLLDAISENPNEILLHLDADIQFFTPTVAPILIRLLGDATIAAQSDGYRDDTNSFCGGFFVFRANNASHQLFTTVLRLMREEKINDQHALNKAISVTECDADLLPADLFWSPRELWNPEKSLSLPLCAIAHHANWCVGVEHKIKQLEVGKALYKQREGIERHGSAYGGKWIKENSLNERSIIYSAGVGEDIHL